MGTDIVAHGGRVAQTLTNNRYNTETTRKILNWGGGDKKVLSHTESITVVVLLPVLTVGDVVEIPAGRIDDLLASLDHRLQVVALSLPHLNDRVRSDLTARNHTH